MDASDFNPSFATAAETADALRKKHISASELLNMTFQRIDRHNPALNAIVWKNREEAVARAKHADDALAKGNASGVLHGVPVTIKESFAYRGSPNTWGLPSLKGANSPRTAVAVERLESAGAIIVGKTNVPVMLGDWQSSYLLFAFVTADMNDEARKQSRTRFESNPEDIAAAAAVAPHARWLHETRRRLAVRALWQTYFESHDVFLLPTTITAAFPHDDSEPIDRRVVDTPEGKRPYARDMPYWISFATLAGVPATVAPVGLTGAGLPVGLQVVAPMWEDGTAIEFAALLSDRVGGFTAPPAFDAAIGA